MSPQHRALRDALRGSTSKGRNGLAVAVARSPAVHSLDAFLDAEIAEAAMEQNLARAVQRQPSLQTAINDIRVTSDILGVTVATLIYGGRTELEKSFRKASTISEQRARELAAPSIGRIGALQAALSNNFALASKIEEIGRSLEADDEAAKILKFARPRITPNSAA